MARPQEFDRDRVIRQAMDVFHRQGYGATSVPDLVKATGLQPGSLYCAFGNKKGVLFEALQVYTDGTLEYIEDTFAQHQSALAGLKAFLRQSTESCKGDTGSYGCFMVNTLLEMAPRDEEVSDLLAQLLPRMERRIADQIRLAQSLHELDSGRDPKILAKFMMTSLWGIRVLSKTKPKAKELKAVVDEVISVLDACELRGNG